MTDKPFTVLDLIDLDLREHNSLNLRCIGGRKGLAREISSPDLNRPMGAIMGFYDVFAHQRIQIFGTGESACLRKLCREGNAEHIKRMFSYPIPCCIFTTGDEPTAFFLRRQNGPSAPFCRPISPRRNLPPGFCGCWWRFSPPGKASTPCLWRFTAWGS